MEAVQLNGLIPLAYILGRIALVYILDRSCLYFGQILLIFWADLAYILDRSCLYFGQILADLLSETHHPVEQYTHFLEEFRVALSNYPYVPTEKEWKDLVIAGLNGAFKEILDQKTLNRNLALIQRLIQTVETLSPQQRRLSRPTCPSCHQKCDLDWKVYPYCETRLTSP
ncbi:MAG: hypothetical protein ACTSYB_08720 [Candidatus Helarchaeota archaeon]